jgi:hypothetical protein
MGINDLLEEEDLKWRQLAKEHWLKAGDKNSKFFHACVKQHRRHNQIEEILDEGGVMCSTEDEVEKAFTSHFQHLFTTSNPICIERCLEGLFPKVTQSMNEQLLQLCSKEEVTLAIEQMAAFKALGPDGLTARFFHDP